MSYRRAVFALVLAPALASGLGAQARPDSTRLDDIVVTATRHPTRLRAVGSASDRIRPAELAARQLGAVRDALRLVPGAAVVGTGAPGGVTSVFLRGVASTQTLYLVDGIRVNDANAEPGGFLGGAESSATAIEVVRGPLSTLYGGSAIGGAVALELPLSSGPPAFRVEAEGGSFGTWRGGLSGSGRTGRLAFVSAFSAGGTDNERRPNGWTQRSQAARLELDLGARVRAGATFRGQQSAYASPGDLRSANPTPAGETTFDQQLGTVYLDAAPARGWTSRLTIGGQRQFTAGSGAFFGDPFRFTLTAHRTVADWQHTVALGRFVRALAGGSGEWTSVWSDGSRNRERLLAGFGQIEVSPADALTLTAGFRHDDYDTFGGATTWRVTGAWLPDGATKVRASYGTGFMPPSLAARYGGPFQNPNPDIRPERSRGYDVGIERFVLSGRGSLGLTWFRTELRDLIGFQSAPFPGLGMSVNVDRARTTGLEAAGRLTSDRADLRLAWTWLSARSESAPSRDVARLIRRPRHTVSADLLYRAGPRLSAGAGLLIVAGREDADFNAFPSVRVDPGNYEVGRLHGSYRLFRDFTLRVRVENVFDRRYEEVYGFPALGRSIHAGASVGF